MLEQEPCETNGKQAKTNGSSQKMSPQSDKGVEDSLSEDWQLKTPSAGRCSGKTSSKEVGSETATLPGRQIGVAWETNPKDENSWRKRISRLRKQEGETGDKLRQVNTGNHGGTGSFCKEESKRTKGDNGRQSETNEYKGIQEQNKNTYFDTKLFLYKC